MHWKYYIPHTWESPDERTTWEDVWLMLEEGGADGTDATSLWFTLDAGKSQEDADEMADEWENSIAESEHGELMGRWLRVGDRELLITPVIDVWIKEEDFDLHELLDWVKRFLTVFFGDPDPVLVEGTFEEFADSNPHARTIGGIHRMLEDELEAETEVEAETETRAETETGAETEAEQEAEDGDSKPPGRNS